jgi:hypothetical protein
MNKTKNGSEGAAENPPDKRYRDAEWLERKYHEEKLTVREIADLCDVTNPCILKWMGKHDIETKSTHVKAQTRNTYNCIKTRHDGYELLLGDSGRIAHHRVLAGLEYGFDAIEGKLVTHKNNIPWDNRMENIEVMSNG